MSFGKILGWIFILYLMIFFQWHRLSAVGRIIGVLWAIVAFSLDYDYTQNSGMIAHVSHS